MIKFYRYKNLKKIKLISGKKDGYFCGKTRKFNHPPLCPPKNTGQEYSKKNIYILRTKRMVILRGKRKNLTTPPMSWQNSMAKNSSDDFLAYGLFLRRG